MQAVPVRPEPVAALERPPAGRSPLPATALAALRNWHPIVVTNRAPFERTRSGMWKRGGGGVVTAMLAAAEATGATWIACTGGMTTTATTAAPGPPRAGRAAGPPVTIETVSLDRETYRKYYGVIANPLLWFVQHYLWPLAYEPVVDESIHDAWHSGYARVNRLVADAVVAAARGAVRRPVVLLQDYHLYLAPRMIRDAIPHAVTQHFVHIPWPTPHYWTVLPEEIRNSILDGLLANDVIGFQTNRDVRNFLAACEELMGLRVDHRERAVLHRGRVSWVRAYPVSVDVAALRRLAASHQVAAEEEAIAQWRPEMLIVRVDRTDPIKNVIRGFLAYEQMLLNHPELAGRVQFWAFLQPSRQDVGMYTEYLERIRREVRRINDAMRRPGWEPIRLELRESLKRAVAAYRAFDVLLVNSIYDGMNLVAKEGMLLNERGGVLVLSENAGAHEQIGRHALSVNPFDVGATADALHRALTMPMEERRARSAAIADEVCREDVVRWLTRQLDDVNELAPRTST